MWNTVHHIKIDDWICRLDYYSINPFPRPIFYPSLPRFQHATSSRSISISRLAYTLLNRAKLRLKLFCPPREVDRNY